MNWQLSHLGEFYRKSKLRDDYKLFCLDRFGLMSLLWQLETGRFEVTGFSEKGFKYYLLSGEKSSRNLIKSFNVGLHEAKLILSNNYEHNPELL